MVACRVLGHAVRPGPARIHPPSREGRCHTRDVAATSHDWIDDQADRTLAGQLARSQGNTLIVTFSLAVSAAFIAAALQVGYTVRLLPAIILFVLAAIQAFVVILSDRLAHPDVPTIIRQTRGMPDRDRLRTLRLSMLTAHALNRRRLKTMWSLTAVQIVLSAVCWGFTILWFVADASRKVGA